MAFPSFPPVLRSERLLVRPFGRADITPHYLGWLNDPVVTRFSNQRFRHHDESSAQAFLAGFAGQPSLFLSVRQMPDDRAIGTMTAHVSPHHGTADMGILLGARDIWGRGYGLECWSLLMAWLIGDAGIRKVTAGTTSVNHGMVQIMERSGMQHEATRHAQELIDGEPVDILYYARFRDA
jgi:RimJ/RimL family protein N-acetyltransferase